MEEIPALEKFGLTRKEAVVYLALLDLGSCTAHTLAKETSLLRQTVYDLLDKLIAQGFVSFFLQNGVKYYQPAEPSCLMALLKEKEQAVRKILPLLKKRKKTLFLPAAVKVYQGIEGIKNIYEDILMTDKDICIYGSANSLIKILRAYFIKNFIKKRLDKKIKVRILTERKEKYQQILKSDPSSLRKSKTLEEMNKIKVLHYLYGNKLAVLSLSLQPYALLIEDETIVSAQRRIFEILWRAARPY